MIRAEKMIFYIFASVLMASIIIFLPQLADGVIPTYLLILGAYVGIDVGIILKKTNALPEGQFKEVNKVPYFVTIAITGILFGIALFMNKKFEAPVTGSLTILSTSVFLVISAYLGVLQGNKLLTGTAPSTPTTN